MAVEMSLRRKTGSYYTEEHIAEAVADWAIRNEDDHVLEPSFGDGVFIDKVIDKFISLGNGLPNISAVEIQTNPYNEFLNSCDINIHSILSDFLSVDIIPGVNAIIGNPPYVSLKNLSEEQQQTAINVLDRHGICMPLNGSLWLPFVLHSTDILTNNGRLAFVLPFEITYTRYAFGMWNFLCSNFANIKVVRLYEDFFPDVDVETILLLADGKGGTTDVISYSVFNTTDEMDLFDDVSIKQIHLTDVVNNKKPFVSELLSKTQLQLISELRKNEIATPIIDYCKFKIGYVSADKSFFHPNENEKLDFNLSKSSLVSCILNAKEINGGTNVGVEVSDQHSHSELFLPVSPSKSDLKYIQQGEKQGVSQRYKCRQRNPWYITPNVEIPDVILTVFGDVPKLVINSGGYAVSNSLLCGTLRGGVTQQQFITMWYNSLTLLSLELTAHSLGGGTFVIIPGEADILEIVKPLPSTVVDDICMKIDRCIKTQSLDDAYKLGDELVLHNLLGITEKQIEDIRSSRETLKNWRNPLGRRILKSRNL